MGLSRKRTQLYAYLAGILDGEGHFGIEWTGNTWNGRIALSMDDAQAVMLLAREFPDHCLAYRMRKPGKPYYSLSFNHYKALPVLDALIPFLVVKQRQAKLLRSFLIHRRRHHSPTKGFDCGGACGRFGEKLKGIRAEAKGVNSVNALLVHELREYRAEPEEVEADVAFMLASMARVGVPQEGVETSADAHHGL
jgi:hypothetical protein